MIDWVCRPLVGFLATEPEFKPLLPVVIFVVSVRPPLDIEVSPFPIDTWLNRDSRLPGPNRSILVFSVARVLVSRPKKSLSELIRDRVYTRKDCIRIESSPVSQDHLVGGCRAGVFL